MSPHCVAWIPAGRDSTSPGRARDAGWGPVPGALRAGDRKDGPLPPTQEGKRAQGRRRPRVPRLDFFHLRLPRASYPKVCPPLSASDDGGLEEGPLVGVTQRSVIGNRTWEGGRRPWAQSARTQGLMAEGLLPGHCPTVGEGAEDQVPGPETPGPPRHRGSHTHYVLSAQRGVWQPETPTKSPAAVSAL